MRGGCSGDLAAQQHAVALLVSGLDASSDVRNPLMSENRTGESQWVLLHYTILRGRGRAINLSGIKVNFHIQAYVRQQQDA